MSEGASQGATLEQIRAMVGAKGPALIIEVEKGKIRNLADAIGDPNPLWQDEEYARQSRFGSIVAPPALTNVHFMASAARPTVPYLGKRRLDGGGEWEFIKPIRPGDKLTSVTSFLAIEERESKRGEMYFYLFETVFTNQKSETVAKSRTTAIAY